MIGTHTFETAPVGTVEGGVNTKIGDLVKVYQGMGHADGSVTPVIVTFRVESVDVLGADNLWCRGPVVDTDAGAEYTAKSLGRNAMTFLGKVVK